MVGIPSGLKALANASFDPGGLSFAPIWGRSATIASARQAKANSRKMIRKTVRPATTVLWPSTAMISRAVQPASAIRTGAARRVPLFYRRLIVIYPEHPICKLTGKQWLVRELP
jgi:hypothetical protein